MIPIRGQTVLVRNDPDGNFRSEEAEEEDEVCYILQRAAGKKSNVMTLSLSGSRQAEVLQVEAP